MSAQSSNSGASSANPAALWERLKETFFYDPETRFGLDISRAGFSKEWWAGVQPKLSAALKSMLELEKGSIANPDEQRMVGHYWLRNPGLSPNAAIKNEIEATNKSILEFASKVHSGTIAPAKGGRFQSLLLVGIGGSALGPQFVTKALGAAHDKLGVYFFDNTDPDGMAQVLGTIPDLSKTLCVVISKSGGTKETRNGMLVARAAWEKSGTPYAKNFVAVTSAGSELDKFAVKEGWLVRFPMWDWVGGRTSELSAVGLLAAALQGYDITRMLAGARDMDELTRSSNFSRNPAAMMAAMWHYLGEGKGARAMVVLPYNDRLELFSRYLQQLLMESLGKERDLDGKVVHQGISVYGNKGSTDQHAYVQQLRDGLNNFFAVFIHVLKDSSPKTSALGSNFSVNNFEVEPGVTSGDYLSGFFQGTRRALFESSRPSLTVVIDEVNEYSVGMLIALFERAVGFYASLININAYHQPGVEAGKKAAADVLSLQTKLIQHLKTCKEPQTIEDLAKALGGLDAAETVFFTLRHLAANNRVKVTPGGQIFADKYSL